MLGSQNMVYVNDWKTMEEIGKQDVFADRIDNFRDPKLGKIVSWMKDIPVDLDHGIINSNGKIWKEQRRLENALRHLKKSLALENLPWKNSSLSSMTKSRMKMSVGR
jgi:hypothetical protein